LTRLAGAWLILFTIGSAYADEAACVVRPAVEAGAKLASLDSGSDRKLEVLAIGSSSTEGIGASSPADTYPARLEDDCRIRTASRRSSATPGSAANSPPKRCCGSRLRSKPVGRNW
jgi:hypothetical protein